MLDSQYLVDTWKNSNKDTVFSSLYNNVTEDPHAGLVSYGLVLETLGEDSPALALSFVTQFNLWMTKQERQ